MMKLLSLYPLHGSRWIEAHAAALLLLLASAAPAFAQGGGTLPCTDWEDNEIAVEMEGPGTLRVRVYKQDGTLILNAPITPKSGCDAYGDFDGDGTGVLLPSEVLTFEFRRAYNGDTTSTVYAYSQGWLPSQDVSFYYPSGSTPTDNRIRFVVDGSTGKTRALWPANNATTYINDELG